MAVYSGKECPAPMPTSSRPIVSWSMAASSRAACTGWWKSWFSTRGHTRRRVVTSAIAISGARADHPSTTWSQVWITSKPASSAARACGRSSSAEHPISW